MNNAQTNGATSASEAPLLQLEDEVDLIGDFVKQQPAAIISSNQLAPLLNGRDGIGVNQLTTQVEVSISTSPKLTKTMSETELIFPMHR